MKTVTIDVIKSWKPCWLKQPGGCERLESVYEGREHWTALDIINDMPSRDVSAKDILWLVLRQELIDEKILHVLACDFAQDAIDRLWTPNYPNDNRPQNAIEAKRRWLRGEATDQELVVAEAAALAAAGSVRATAGAAALAAAGSARAAAEAAALAALAARTAALAAAAAAFAAWGAAFAAWGAALAAGDAARAEWVGGVGAGGARDAAWAAARERQIFRVKQVLAAEAGKDGE